MRNIYRVSKKKRIFFCIYYLYYLLLRNEDTRRAYTQCALRRYISHIAKILFLLETISLVSIYEAYKSAEIYEVMVWLRCANRNMQYKPSFRSIVVVTAAGHSKSVDRDRVTPELKFTFVSINGKAIAF